MYASPSLGILLTNLSTHISNSYNFFLSGNLAKFMGTFTGQFQTGLSDE